jgi:hypothetical protein
LQKGSGVHQVRRLGANEAGRDRSFLDPARNDGDSAERSGDIQSVWITLPWLQNQGEAVRALLLALALFLARDVQALDRSCATLSTKQLVACLQDCPDAQPGVACRRSCVHQHNKAKSACRWPPIHAPGPLVIGVSDDGADGASQSAQGAFTIGPRVPTENL